VAALVCALALPLTSQVTIYGWSTRRHFADLMIGIAMISVAVPPQSRINSTRFRHELGELYA